MKKKANQPKSKNTDQTTAQPAAQINDLPPTDEQAEQAKGGTLKYNFGGIEGAASSIQPILKYLASDPSSDLD